MKYKKNIQTFKGELASELGEIFGAIYLMGVQAERSAAIEYLSKNSSKRAAQALESCKHVPRGKDFMYLKNINIDQDYFDG